MIKANELRSGNLVQGKSLSIPRLQIINDGVTRITAYGIHVIESEQYTNYKPIPLTEEWLIKCGFKFQNILKKAYQRNLYLYKGFGIYEVKPKEFFYKEIQIKYVHQLQNLYFALTGDELEINL